MYIFCMTRLVIKVTHRNSLLWGNLCLSLTFSSPIISSTLNRAEESEGNFICLFLQAAINTEANCANGLPTSFLNRYLFVPDNNTTSPTRIAHAQIPYPNFLPTLSWMYTSTVTAVSAPTLMRKKNQLKNLIIRPFSFGSDSSNWSVPKPETLDFKNPVPRAVM